MYDELVKSLRDCAEINSLSLYKRGLMKQAADAIEELLQKMQQLPRWIPVTERLPEGQFPVQVYVPPHTDEEEEYVGYVGMAYHTNSARGGFWCGTDGAVYGAIGIIHEPSYWMPLPEPPKEE